MELKTKLNNGYIVGIVFSIAMGVIMIFVIPPLQIFAMFQNEESIDRRLRGRFDQLLYGIKTKTRSQRSYHLVFVVRRLIFIALVLFNDFLQLPILLLVNLLFSMHVCSSQRVVNRYHHWIEVNNEFFFSVIYILMTLFSDWATPEVKQWAAWIYVGTKSTMVFTNLLIIIYFGLRAATLVPVSYTHLRAHET